MSKWGKRFRTFKLLLCACRHCTKPNTWFKKKKKNSVEDYIQMLAPLRIWWNKKLSFRGQTVDGIYEEALRLNQESNNVFGLSISMTYEIEIRIRGGVYLIKFLYVLILSTFTEFYYCWVLLYKAPWGDCGCDLVPYDWNRFSLNE